jgi:GT2 family glycosyltransferase
LVTIAGIGGRSQSEKLNHPDVVSWFQRGRECPAAELHLASAPGRQGTAIAVCTYRRADSLVRFLDSLREQQTPDELVIVDASPDGETEERVRAYADPERLSRRLLYVRVGGSLKGLTRQRNFAAGLVTTDLVAFFDDDIVLERDCLLEMERAHRELGEEVAGVAALTRNLGRPRRRLWRLRLRLHMVGSLRAGSYQRSGMSIPWTFLLPTEEWVDGDWLPGGATMWRTAVVRQVGFWEAMGGYAQGEDLDFSLRARRRGRLILAGSARVQHLHEFSGRPDPFRMGYMAIHNRFQIHRRGLADRSFRDVAWFVYTWTLDSLLLARHLVIPKRVPATLREIAGRAKAAADLVRGR